MAFLAVENAVDIQTDTSRGRKLQQDLGPGYYVKTYVAKADSGNSVNVLIGGGMPLYPLVPGEVRVIDLPVDTVLDASQLSIADATNVGKQIIHFAFFRVNVQSPLAQ